MGEGQGVGRLDGLGHGIGVMGRLAFVGLGEEVALVGVVLVLFEQLDLVLPDVTLAILELQKSALFQDC